MINQFLDQNLKRAKYKILADGTYFGEIPRVRGVWANAKNIEACRKELASVLEEWMALRHKMKLPIPFNQQS